MCTENGKLFWVNEANIIKFYLQFIFIPLFINNPLTFKTLETSIIFRNRSMNKKVVSLCIFLCFSKLQEICSRILKNQCHQKKKDPRLINHRLEAKIQYSSKSQYRK